MSKYQPVCSHKYQRKERVSRGDNLIGDIVTCVVEDLKCKNCGTETLRVIYADPKYSKISIV